MYRKATPLFLICETPTHAGSGSELGIVDLPIQREKHTAFPKIESSSIKGAIRESIERKVNSRTFTDWANDDTRIQRLFGYDEGSLNDSEKANLRKVFTHQNNQVSNEFAGCMGFTDARLLLFPVKSMKGVFAWITCPKVLQQFALDLKLAGIECPSIPVDSGLISKDSSLVLSNGQQQNVVLEEYAYPVTKDDTTTRLNQWLADQIFPQKQGANHQKMAQDIVVLSNDDFKDFVSLSTEVITRTKINNVTGTVEPGALFTEEYLPTETVMYTLVLTSQEFTEESRQMTQEQVWDFFQKKLPEVFQIGGNSSLGKGLMSTRLVANATTAKTKGGQNA